MLANILAYHGKLTTPSANLQLEKIDCPDRAYFFYYEEDFGLVGHPRDWSSWSLRFELARNMAGIEPKREIEEISMRKRMEKKPVFIGRTLVFLILVTLTGCGTLFDSGPSCLHDVSPWGEKPDGRINLEQCWDDTDQQHFYSTSQGSHVAPYDIATHIEWYDKQEKFLSPQTIRRYGYLTSEHTAPWPLGWVKDSAQSGEIQGDWIGMTCAACHTAEIEYAGRKIRIDGGPTMADAIGFINEFDKSLEETYKDGLKEDGRSGEKFDRYAQHFEGKSKEALDLPPGTSPPSKLDLGPFEVHSMG